MAGVTDFLFYIKKKMYIRSMANIRKYPKTSGYFVYAHVLPTKEVYIGMSKMQPSQRWRKSRYKNQSLDPYIEQYGWENIEHKVLIDGLTKNEAEAWEDKLIVALSMNGICVNKQRSGGIERDDKQSYHNKYNKQWYKENKEEKKAKQKQYREEHKEEINQYYKQRNSTPEGKIYTRVAAYNQRHPNKAIETPSEAKQKYLEFGYIPNYIKNDDLC